MLSSPGQCHYGQDATATPSGSCRRAEPEFVPKLEPGPDDQESEPQWYTETEKEEEKERVATQQIRYQITY
jgi:hypothetical protein